MKLAGPRVGLDVLLQKHVMPVAGPAIWWVGMATTAGMICGAFYTGFCWAIAHLS